MKILRSGIAVIVAALAASCGSDVGSGGKSSTVPLVLNLQASPQHAWANGAVTFSVTCLSASGSNDQLTYRWSFGDNTTVTTVTGTTTHVYALPSNTPTSNTYDTYNYSVSCTDSAYNPAQTLSSRAAVIPVLREDLGAVSSATCNYGFQGIGWCWQNPLPTGNSLRAILAQSSYSGWAVGDNGTLLVTSDGGETWKPSFLGTSGAPPDLVAIRATTNSQNVQELQVLGRDGTVFSSLDAGGTWIPQSPSIADMSLSSAEFTSSGAIWAVNNSSSIVAASLGSSTTGNVTWSTAYISGYSSFASVSGLDSKTAVAVGTPAGDQLLQPFDINIGFAVSTNDGTSWTASEFPLYADPIGSTQDSTIVSSVSLVSSGRCGSTSGSSSTAWVGGVSRYRYSGANQYQISFSLSAPITPNLNWSLGQGGGANVLIGLDANTAWGLQAAPFGQAPSFSQSVEFTTTGINGWQSSTPFSSPLLNAIDSPDCLNGWAVGEAGAIWRTVNGAQVWTPQSSSALNNTAPGTGDSVSAIGTLSLGAVAAANTLQAFAIDDELHDALVPNLVNRVFETNNGGLTWIPQIETGGGPPSGESFPLTISANAAGQALAVAPAKNAVFTRFGGWAEQFEGSTYTAYPNAWPFQTIPQWPSSYTPQWIGASINDNTAWVLDSQGLVVSTAVGAGNTWRVATVPQSVVGTGIPNFPSLPASTALSAIAALGSSSAVVVGEEGYIARTTDGGTTWTVLTPSVTANLNAISLSAAGTGWAVGDMGSILKTMDGGQTWQAKTWPDTGVRFKSVSTQDGVIAWVIGQSSSGKSVVLYTADGMTWSTQTVPTSSLNGVSAADRNNAWIVGDSGTILRTATGGQLVAAPPH